MELDIDQWAALYGIPPHAIEHLRRIICQTVGFPAEEALTGGSEAAVSDRVRLEAGRRSDIFLNRNNVGALKDSTGRLVRYGLANESKEMNDTIKSGDFIFIYRRLIRPEDVGTYLGQFGSCEVKKEGWKYTGQGREKPQMTWAESVRSFGGIATFYAGGAAGAFDMLPRY